MKITNSFVLLLALQGVSLKIEGVFSTLGKLLKRENISLPKPEQAFERGRGFWSTPNDEVQKSFFGKLTEVKSQREDWYKVSPYIAEFWCTLSNIGFFQVAYQHNSPELLFAGLASTISHSIPKQWLLMVDKLGVAVVLSKIIREHQVLLNNPWLMVPVGVAGLVNLTDMYLARNKAQTWPHVVWHASAALVAHEFLKNC